MFPAVEREISLQMKAAPHPSSAVSWASSVTVVCCPGSQLTMISYGTEFLGFAKASLSWWVTCITGSTSKQFQRGKIGIKLVKCRWHALLPSVFKVLEFLWQPHEVGSANTFSFFARYDLFLQQIEKQFNAFSHVRWWSRTQFQLSIFIPLIPRGYCYLISIIMR